MLSAQKTVSIIPEPVSIVQKSGNYNIGKVVKIYNDGKLNGSYILNELKDVFRKYDITTVFTNKKSEATISFSIFKKQEETIKQEGYYLDVDTKGISIKANEDAGLYYAVQTLKQLIDNGDVQTFGIPYVTIVDYPQVAWRGILLDVARHFFTKEEVKKYIDEISAFKFNILQLHLTDDGGWRIEIKKYPKLTQVGSWGVKKVGEYGEFSEVESGEKYNYGGFYTQEDIKEIVQYAKAHYIDILPEIDVPGHCMAAVASYPELSGTKDAVNYKVYSGEKDFMDWTDSGIVARYDNTLNPAKSIVYRFLDDVFGEVAQLFPFGYIHVGGDECAKNFWKKDSAIARLMAQEKLKTYEEVQSYFEKRVEAIVTSKGKKLIGWDEILEGGVSDHATVMSWRGENGGIEAAKLKHDVVMTPNDFVYIDLMQGTKYIESPVYASLRLKKVYDFTPFPRGIDSQYVKGGQANLWTEQIYTFPKVEYMTWPRGLAVSESLWSPSQKKNWPKFVDKLTCQMDVFDRDTIAYAMSMYEPDIQVSYNKDSSKLFKLDSEIDNLSMYYTLDGSFPDVRSDKYNNQPVMIPKDAKMLRIQSYYKGKKSGRLISVAINELH
ncbi:MAG: family 20 glycosylhydrolase [Chitinophagaceae bacterium]